MGTRTRTLPIVLVSQCPSVLVSQCSSIPVSQCPGITVSQCPGILVSWYLGVLVFWCPGILVSRCPYVPVSWCPSLPVYQCPSNLWGTKKHTRGDGETHKEGGDGETHNFWDRQTDRGSYRGGAHLKMNHVIFMLRRSNEAYRTGNIGLSVGR